METKRAIEVLQQNAEFVDAEFEDAIAIAISALEKQERETREKPFPFVVGQQTEGLSAD